MYDFVIVGAGFFGATFARLATDAGRRCIVIDRRDHVGGNAYTYRVDDIDVHRYGPHIFHTNSAEIWNFVNRFSVFNNYVHCPKARRDGRIYSLPFNMNTFYQIWGVQTPAEAKQLISDQIVDGPAHNLEQQALALVGRDIYDRLIRDYTQKQWHKHPRDLPAEIIKRLPLRWTYDDRYFDDRYQGIPQDGYTALFERMLDGIDIELNIDFAQDQQYWFNQSRHLIYTGAIDEFFGYRHGALEYRTLEFDTQIHDTDNFQGTAVINSCDADTPYTRTIEHRHFSSCRSPRTVITHEIPVAWQPGRIPYYPINDKMNDAKYTLYRNDADRLPHVTFGGRLAEYRYYDMHQVIGSAMKRAKEIL